MPTAPHASLLHIARQPILDTRQKVYGYELLYRGTADATAFQGDVTSAAARVVGDVVAGPELDAVTGGARAFVNLSAEVILADASSLVPPDRVVLEILETVEVTPAIVAQCQSLADRGYTIALDDYVPGSPAEALLPYATFVKIDVLALGYEALAEVTPTLLGRGVSVVAEKVETADGFARAKAAGCSLFQGYYFCRPEATSVRVLSANQIAQMQLMAALLRPDVSLGAIEDLLKQDTTLAYRVLRTVNSAAFGLRREIRSIRDALLLLGLDQIRKWASLWTLAALNRGPSELVTMTVVRARTCETLGRAMGRGDQGYFLLGMCSLLDVLLGVPMPQAIADLPVTDDIREALLGGTNDARLVLDAVAAYERGDWLGAIERAAAAGLEEDALADAYRTSLQWARALTAGAS